MPDANTTYARKENMKDNINSAQVGRSTHAVIIVSLALTLVHICLTINLLYSYTVKALHLVVFPMNVTSWEFNFADFVFIILLQCTAKVFVWYLISLKQFIQEIREINPMKNLRLLQYYLATKAVMLMQKCSVVLKLNLEYPGD